MLHACEAHLFCVHTWELIIAFEDVKKGLLELSFLVKEHSNLKSKMQSDSSPFLLTAKFALIENQGF